MLRYSSSAQKVKPRFYRYYNDIDVYVEDEHDEAFYGKLLGKIVGGSIRIRKVFGVGGKPKLLEEVDKFIKKPSIRKTIFIADADFDKILKRKFPNTELLYILNEYCIENFLFEEQAICDLIEEETIKRRTCNIVAQIKISKWLEEIVDKLTPLFACFIIIQKENMGFPNVDIGLGRFLSNARIPKLDMMKVQIYLDSFKEYYEASQQKDYYIESQKITRRMGKRWRTRKKYICGKSYLFPLLRFEIKKYSNSDIKLKRLRFRIMNKCQFKSLSELRSRIEAVCAN